MQYRKKTVGLTSAEWQLVVECMSNMTSWCNADCHWTHFIQGLISRWKLM